MSAARAVRARLQLRLIGRGRPKLLFAKAAKSGLLAELSPNSDRESRKREGRLQPVAIRVDCLSGGLLR